VGSGSEARPPSDTVFCLLVITLRTSLGTVNRVAPFDQNYRDITAIIRFCLGTFEWPIE
jgi:hypothetical protein